MPSPLALVITSISPPNTALAEYAKESQANGLDFIVIGDVKSPSDFYLDGCDFWGIARQRDMPLRLAHVLPENHYARKNLGYLVAMQRGAEVIVETDDDNLPLGNFWEERTLEQTAVFLEDQGWVNIYRHFSDDYLWPRGFPLEFVQTSAEIMQNNRSTVPCPIQQGLADGNPDVDAIYRLLMPLPVSFRQNDPVALGRGCWSPFNSQNTTWFKPAFPLLYIPSLCSFRMCDIWRSFVATRICWENNWNILFHAPTVYQERNDHNLLKDFSDEIPGYQHNAQICAELTALELRGGSDYLGDDLRSCYDLLTRHGYIPADEMLLLDAWLADIATLDS